MVEDGLVDVPEFESKSGKPYRATPEEAVEIKRDQGRVQYEELKLYILWYGILFGIPSIVLAITTFDWRFLLGIPILEVVAHIVFQVFYHPIFPGGPMVPEIKEESFSSGWNKIMGLSLEIIGFIFYLALSNKHHNALLYVIPVVFIFWGLAFLSKKPPDKKEIEVKRKEYQKYLNEDGTPKQLPPKWAMRLVQGVIMVSDVIRPRRILVFDIPWFPWVRLGLVERFAPEMDMDVIGTASGINGGKYELLGTITLILPSDNPIHFRDSLNIPDEKILKGIFDNLINQIAVLLISGKTDKELIEEGRNFNPEALKLLIGRDLKTLDNGGVDELINVTSGNASIYLPSVKAILLQAQFVVRRSKELQEIYDQKAKEEAQSGSDIKDIQTTIKGVNMLSGLPEDNPLELPISEAVTTMMAAQGKVKKDTIRHEVVFSDLEEVLKALGFLLNEKRAERKDESSKKDDEDKI